MMNMFRRLRRKKGFTLTELIVVIAIIGLLMACVAAFAQPVRSTVTGVRNNSDTLKISEIIGNYLERRVAYADMIDAYVGYSLSSSDVESGFKQLVNTSEANTIKPDSLYTKGMLVFRFEESADGDEFNTFRLYDVPIHDTDTGVPSDLSSYSVFNDDFYSGYQFFITTNEKMGIDGHFGNVNNLTHNAFFTFSILGYSFKNSSTAITSDFITDYYDYITNGGDSDPINQLISARTALEEVSFIFENIRIMPAANGIYNNYVDTNRIDIKRKTDSTDVAIFYAIRNYRSLDITT